MPAQAIYKPEDAMLTDLMAEATQNGKVSPDQWQARYLEGAKALLQANPIQYRSYGPFWWLLKRAFIQGGTLVFGEHLDAEWLEATEYGDPAKNLMATFVYAEYAINHGLIRSSEHAIGYLDGESDFYVLADEDMEALAAAKTLAG